MKSDRKFTESKTENTEYKTKDHDIKTQSTMQVSVTEDKSQGGDPQKKKQLDRQDATVG